MVEVGIDKKEKTEYLLGTYRHDQTIEDAKKFDQLNPPKTKINNIEYPYFPVHYRHGTPCDLTGKPRTVTLLYICYEYSRHAVHSITEVSTCNYEISVLTNLLCSHPAFDMPTNPEHEIRCYAPPNHPHAKPNFLRDLETKAFSEHYDQYSMASDVSVAPHKSSVFSKLINHDGLIFPQRTGDAAAAAAAGNVDANQQMNDNNGKTVSEQLKEIAEIYKKLQASDSKPKNKMAKFQKGFTDDDFQLIEDFWAGKSCFIGGHGYWSYEFCYGSKVSQFHLEGGKRTKEHVLGEYDAELHRAWLRRYREKAFVYEDDYLKQVSNFYGNGVLCDETGEKRSVEVQLRCRMPAQSESPSIVLFSLEEPETCKYKLTLESALLCNGLQNLDKDGLMDPNAEEFTTEIVTDEEAIKKIIENIKTTKQYLEQLGGQIIIKEVTEEFEELLQKKNNRDEKEDDDDVETDDRKKKSKN
uniref:Endoplasmic reticulum lectin 1 n=1 Tax=Panagrolaimus superbus TaxID=310955 RepID=A0A914YJW5_9BILA